MSQIVWLKPINKDCEMKMATEVIKGGSVMRVEKSLTISNSNSNSNQLSQEERCQGKSKKRT